MAKTLIDYGTFFRERKELSDYAESELNLSANARLIFDKVYCKSLEDGTRETPAQRIAAISLDIASAEMAYFPTSMAYEKKLAKVKKIAREYTDLQVSNKFRANTPTNINMGRWQATYDDEGEITGYNLKNQLGSACFVIPIEDTFGDSVEKLNGGILEAWITQQHIHKGGGGTGMSFSSLRPKGSIIGYNPSVDGIKSIDWDFLRGVSSGAESFLEYFFNPATDAVKQGNTRRGANMGIQRVDHQDFLDHLYAKFGTKERQSWRNKNFNLSMAVTDEFMEAALNGGTYTLYNPQRADPLNKKILEKKYGIKNPELVRKGDLATKEQFERILEKNSRNVFSPLTTPNMYLDSTGDNVINAYTGEKIGMIVNDIVHIDAKKILNAIAELSHTNGEPGLFFIDRANEHNSLLNLQEIESLNPCGEQPLLPNEACNLGSINVGKFIEYKVYNNSKEIDLEKKVMADEFTRINKRNDGKIGVIYVNWRDFDKTVSSGVRFLDGVIDRSDFPAKKITEMVSKTRKIGLGLMGVADAFILMKMKYGADDAVRFSEALAKRLYEKSLEESQKLAKEKGVFPLIKGSGYDKESELFKWYESNPTTIPDKFRGKRKLSNLVDRKRYMKRGMDVRNDARNTQAPTGTIRRATGEENKNLRLDNLIIASGMEAYFALYEESNILNTQVKDLSWGMVELFDREGIYSPELVESIKRNKGSVFVYSYTPKDVAEELSKIPEEIRDVLVTAAGGEGNKYEITPEEHVNELLAFQRYNDSAISKTINLPKSSQKEDTLRSYTQIWRGGAKGGTVYRDKSRDFQILNTTETTENREEEGKFERTLLQRGIIVETPYIGSQASRTSDSIDFDPGSCFTTVTYDKRGRITGVFQNVAEVDPERASNITMRSIHLSRTFKEGRHLEKIIKEIEKVGISGGKKGVMVDKGVMQILGSKETMKYQIEGGTSAESLLNALYCVRFLTGKGENFNEAAIKEKIDSYLKGHVTLRGIINAKGGLVLEEDKNGNPSILGKNKIIQIPNDFLGSECPECG